MADRLGGEDGPARRTPAWALARDVLLLGVIWGASVVLQRYALAEVRPLPLVTLRLLAGLAFFVPFAARLARGLPRDQRTLANIALIGVLNPGASSLCSAAALGYGSSGLLAILASLGPLVSALLARLYRAEHALRRGQIAGIAAAFGGVLMLVAGRSTGLGPEYIADARTYVFGLLLAASLALSAVHARHVLKDADPFTVAGGQMLAGLVLALPAQLLAAEPLLPVAFDVRTWLAVLLSGTVGLGASFVLLVVAIHRHGPTATLLLLYVVPVTAAGLGILLLGETVDGPIAIGAALILGGVLLFTRGADDPGRVLRNPGE